MPVPNRLLVAVVTAESTAGAWSVTATKGAGVNFTTAVENPNSATHGVWIGYLTESQIKREYEFHQHSEEWR